MDVNLTFRFCCSITGEESLVGLAAEAARKALQMANIDPDDVDLISMCSSTPEDLFGSAPQVTSFLTSATHKLIYYGFLNFIPLPQAGTFYHIFFYLSNVK